MKHQYESELIKEIIDTRGHEKSSLHYESECIETWIAENEGAYPKLCDYESEWIKYISILDDTGGGEDPEPPIGEFPYIVLSDVTEATINNVVPYAYKSAILKGNTLTNLFPTESLPISSDGGAKDFPITYSSGKTYTVMLKLTLPSFKEGVKEVVIECGFLSAWSKRYVAKLTEDNTTFTLKFKNLIENSSGAGIRVISPYSKLSENLIINEFVVIEGDYTNIDIPFFEGMQSVKMPVLTTSNEDGTKTNILTVNEDVTSRSNGDVYDELNLLTGRLTQRIDENNEVLSQEVVKSVDLTITNQDGETLNKLKPIEGTMHLSTSSDTIKPLFSGEIPVEAITQNLASFIDLETEG